MVVPIGNRRHDLLSRLSPFETFVGNKDIDRHRSVIGNEIGYVPALLNSAHEQLPVSSQDLDDPTLLMFASSGGEQMYSDDVPVECLAEIVGGNKDILYLRIVADKVALAGLLDIDAAFQYLALIYGDVYRVKPVLAAVALYQQMVLTHFFHRFFHQLFLRLVRNVQM